MTRGGGSRYMWHPQHGWTRFWVGLAAGLVAGWVWSHYLAGPLWDWMMS